MGETIRSADIFAAIGVERDKTTLTMADDSRSTILDRIDQLRAAAEAPTENRERERLERRIANLQGKVAVLRVGGATETQQRETKARVDDAVHATRAAVKEGTVVGGGVALLRAAQRAAANSVDPDLRLGFDIVLSACREPLIAIADNAGRSGTAVCMQVGESSGDLGYNAATDRFENLVRAGVIDPVLVVRTALDRAASLAGILLTTDATVLENRKDD